LRKLLIGTGGWAYFDVPGLDPLQAYSRAFNSVEVNSTFYEYPDPALVRSWRQRVPHDFHFAVRCHRDLTHNLKLQPSERAHEVLQRMVSICRMLDSQIMHIQTPPSMRFNGATIHGIRDLFSSEDLKGMRVAWEPRRREGQALGSDVAALMRDMEMIHCVDISKQDPEVDSDILYSRLFGHGKQNIYQFSDEELKEIQAKVTKPEIETAVLAFHGVKMYNDAARLKLYVRTDKFPMATMSIGLDSVQEVLAEDAIFPSPRSSLIEHQGWKLVDLTSSRRCRISEILERVPNKTYRSISEVVDAVRSSGALPDDA